MGDKHDTSFVSLIEQELPPSPADMSEDQRRHVLHERSPDLYFGPTCSWEIAHWPEAEPRALSLRQMGYMARDVVKGLSVWIRRSGAPGCSFYYLAADPAGEVRACIWIASFLRWAGGG